MEKPKHRKLSLQKKTYLLILMAIVLTLSSTASFASYYNDAEEKLRNIYIFKFYNQENGIGYGNCPVYTAPYYSAVRLANGKASCDTNSYMSVGGYDATGWLMVRYETNENKTRVGYIPSEYVRGYRARINLLEFDNISAVARDTIYITDNPMSNSNAFDVLNYGDSFSVLGRYNYVGNWWYIECMVDNQVARGFIEVGSKFDVVDTNPAPNPAPISTKKTNLITGEQIGTVTVRGVITNSDARIVRQLPNADSDIVARVYDGEQYPCYDVTNGTSGKKWYKILVNESWGWISSGVSVLQ